MAKIPDYILPYLWDVNQQDLAKASAEFVIERVLEYGNEKAFDWLRENYPKEIIVATLKKSRKISPKTGNFFALYYHLDKKELECIRKPFTRKQDRF